MIYLQISKCYPRQPVPFILLNIDTQKYVFNIPDGCQRFLSTYKMNPLRDTNFFVTKLDSDHFDGLFGLVQTMFANKQSENCKIYGPLHITELIARVKELMVVGYCLLNFSVHDFYTSKQIQGTNDLSQIPAEHYKIIKQNEDPGQKTVPASQQEPVKQEQPVKSKKDEKKLFYKIADTITNTNIFRDNNVEIVPIMINRFGQASDSLSQQQKPEHAKSRPQISYLCKMKKLPGRINKQKLDQLGLQNSVIAQLVKLGKIEHHNQTIYLDDLKEKDFPGPLVLILECEDLEDLK